MPAFPHGFPFIALFQPACPQERGGTVFSLSLSLSLSLTTLLFSCRKERLRRCFPLYGQRRSAAALPASVFSLLAEWFFRVACCNAFFCSGGILVRTADCPWRRAVRFRGGTIPVPGDPLQHSLRQGEEEGQAPGRIPEIREMPSEFSERGFEDEEGVRRTSSRPECVAVLMSWSQGDAGGGLFSPSCGTFARFLNAGGEHREEGNRLAASGGGDKKGGAG